MARKIYTTKDYSKFHFIPGNRPIIPAHVDEMVRKFKEDDLMVVITTNEKGGIVDGQHRYLALKKLGRPIHYDVRSGWGLAEARKINQGRRNWKPSDFLHSFLDESKEYKTFEWFQKAFGFNHGTTLMLLSGSTARLKGDVKKFQSGTFVCRDLAAAKHKALMIKDFAPYYDGFKRRGFISAALRMFKCASYNHSIMMRKMTYLGYMLEDRRNAEDYIQLLEYIYNYKLRKSPHIRIAA